MGSKSTQQTEVGGSNSVKQLGSLLKLVVNSCLNNIMYWRQGGCLLSKQHVSGTDSSNMYHASEVERSLDMASKALMHKNITIEMLQEKLEERESDNNSGRSLETVIKTKEGEPLDVMNDFLIEARRIAASPSSSNNSNGNSFDCMKQLQLPEEVGISKSTMGIDTTGLVLKLSETMQELHEYKARANRQEEEIRAMKEELDRIRDPKHTNYKDIVDRTTDNHTLLHKTEAKIPISIEQSSKLEMEKQLVEKDAIIAELAQLVASREAAQIALVETVQEFLQQQSMPSTPRCSSSQGVDAPKLLEDQIDYWQERLHNQADEAVERLRRGES